MVLCTYVEGQRSRMILKFRMFKISQFLISYAQQIFEIYENLHHMKISHYTVYHLYLILNICHGSISHQHTGNFKSLIEIATSFNQSSFTSLVDRNYLYKLNNNVHNTVKHQDSHSNSYKLHSDQSVTIVEENYLYKTYHYDTTETIENWCGL